MTIDLLDEGAFRTKYDAFKEDSALAQRCFDRHEVREILEYVCSVMGRTVRPEVRFPARDFRSLSIDHRNLVLDTLDRAGFGLEWCDDLGLAVTRPLPPYEEPIAYAI